MRGILPFIYVVSYCMFYSFKNASLTLWLCLSWLFYYFDAIVNEFVFLDFRLVSPLYLSYSHCILKTTTVTQQKLKKYLFSQAEWSTPTIL
jgi:hypothetical protein